MKITTYNEVFTIKGNSTKGSMFRRRPQNRLKENIITKQRNDEKQAWFIWGWIKNSRSNCSLLEHFYNETVPKKVKVVCTCC